jgi:amino-acid N-acetyltransferase
VLWADLLPVSGQPVFRRAVPADRAAVERILTMASLPTVGITTLLTEHAADFVVADDPVVHGELAAVAGIERCGPRDALLRSVAVHPRWRRHALAHQAVSTLIDHASQRGVESVYLLTTTAADYFPRLGFAPVDRGTVPATVAATEEFTDACPASAIVMRRSLTRAPTSS